MSEKEKKLNNRGFTLIELLVSLLVSSFVVLSASFFLSAGIRSYTTTNQEVSLQMEAHIAQNLLETLIIESSSCEYIPNYSYGTGDCTIMKIGCTDKSSSSLYIVILDGERHKLLLKKLTDSDPRTYENIIGSLSNEDAVKALVAAELSSDRPALLADYCTVFR